MVVNIRRRKVLLLTSALVVASIGAHGQQVVRTRRIGVLGGAPGPRWSAFEAVLRESGWREGENVQILWRWSGGTPERIPELAIDLVRLKVDVIVTEGDH